MIRPVLKAVDAVDHDPIEAWTPDGEHVLFELTLHVGSAEAEGADLYRVLVGNPEGLKAAQQSGEPLPQTPPIVAAPYLWASVATEIERRLASCADTTWLRVQGALSQCFAWEYEGMAPKVG